jgi:hypothetical protein
MSMQQGVCTLCVKAPVEPGKQLCEACRWKLARWFRRKEEGNG